MRRRSTARSKPPDGSSQIGNAWLKPHQRIEILAEARGPDGEQARASWTSDRARGRQAAHRRAGRNRSRHRRRAQCRRRAARHGRPGNPDGADAGEHRSAGLHDRRADRRRRRHLGLQSSLESDRPSGRAGGRHRLPGDRQAGEPDAALLPGVCRPASRGRAAARVGVRFSFPKPTSSPRRSRPIRGSPF